MNGNNFKRSREDEDEDDGSFFKKTKRTNQCTMMVLVTVSGERINLLMMMMLVWFVAVVGVYGAAPSAAGLYPLLRFQHAMMSTDSQAVRDAAEQVMVIPPFSQKYKTIFFDFLHSLRSALFNDVISP
ncbi:MAG: hypothetical protein WCO09_05080, partial [bacterium]